MSPSLRSVLQDHTDLVGERLRLVREQRADVGHQRFADGYRAALETLGRRPVTPWAPHTQTNLQGIEVDERLSPLLGALWRLGFDTRYSCQGHPEHYIADETSTHDALAYIAFVDLAQGIEFITKTVDLLGFVPWEEGRLVCSPMVPKEDGVIRGFTQFPPTLFEEITRAWVSHAATGQNDR